MGSNIVCVFGPLAEFGATHLTLGGGHAVRLGEPLPQAKSNELVFVHSENYADFGGLLDQCAAVVEITDNGRCAIVREGHINTLEIDDRIFDYRGHEWPLR